MQIRWSNTYSKIIGNGYCVGYTNRNENVWVVTCYPYIYVLIGKIIEDDGTDGLHNSRGTNPQRAFLGKVVSTIPMQKDIAKMIMQDVEGAIIRHGATILPDVRAKFLQ